MCETMDEKGAEMTREEARVEIEEEFKIFLEGTSLNDVEILEEKMKDNAELRKVVEANMMAIKALEQTDVLDKIRAEIETNTEKWWYGVNDDCFMKLSDVLEIINKYRKEQNNASSD